MHEKNTEISLAIGLGSVDLGLEGDCCLDTWRISLYYEVALRLFGNMSSYIMVLQSLCTSAIASPQRLAERTPFIDWARMISIRSTQNPHRIHDVLDGVKGTSFKAWQVAKAICCGAHAQRKARENSEEAKLLLNLGRRFWSSSHQQIATATFLQYSVLPTP